MYSNIKKTNYKRKTPQKFRAVGNGKQTARRIRANYIFKKQLNSVAEKKVKSNYIVNNQSFLSSGVNAPLTPASGCIAACWPASGSDLNERVGSKIFIRYLKLSILITNVDATHATVGNVGLLFLKEKKPQAISSVYISSIMADGATLPIVDGQLIKTTFDTMELTIYKLQAVATAQATGYLISDTPYNRIIKKTIRVMKEYSIGDTGLINGPDYFLPCMYFSVPWSVNLTNPGVYYVFGSMSYTDV